MASEYLRTLGEKWISSQGIFVSWCFWVGDVEDVFLHALLPQASRLINITLLVFKCAISQAIDVQWWIDVIPVLLLFSSQRWIDELVFGCHGSGFTFDSGQSHELICILSLATVVSFTTDDHSRIIFRYALVTLGIRISNRRDGPLDAQIAGLITSSLLRTTTRNSLDFIQFFL
jgi:hypothetical protein